ncbi:MAG TPA: tetratricopeptide repeat protein, partial [Bacteroidia bacterium]
SESFATKFFILFRYISLLIFPHPLSCDYGYNQIPYISLFSYKFIFSFLLIITLAGIALFTFRSRSIFSFCILYFFVTISIGTNFIADLGTLMAERMLFQPSLAICILFSVLYFQIKNKHKIFSGNILALVFVLFSIKTFARNFDWKNNETLYLADVHSAPNSVRTNQYASEWYLIKADAEPNMELKRTYFEKAIYYSECSLRIYPDNPTSLCDLGRAYSGVFDFIRSADCFEKAYKLKPDYPEIKTWMITLSDILYKKGNGYYENDNFPEAIKYYKKAVQLNENNTEAWYDLGVNYFLVNDSVDATKAWIEVKKLDPNHPLKKEEFWKKE